MDTNKPDFELCFLNYDLAAIRGVQDTIYINGFTELLVEQGVGTFEAAAIAAAACGRMSSVKLHYHTPLHVLSMFGFAQHNKIELTADEELILWMHDIIYDETMPSGRNERLSAKLSEALLNGYVSQTVIKFVSSGIVTTAQHLEDSVPIGFQKIMDLDVSTFAWPDHLRIVARENIRLEYLEATDKQYHQGSLAFLKKLIEKGYVYRTEFFVNNFEELAMKNILAEIEEHENALR